MAEIARLDGCIDWIDLSFCGARADTARWLMELGIRLYLSGLSLSDTIRKLEKFGGERSHKAVHDYVQKANLQPATDTNPNYVALDETVIRIDDQQYWLYAAVNLETNRILHTRLSSTTMIVFIEIVLRKWTEKYDVAGAIFLVDGIYSLQTALHQQSL